MTEPRVVERFKKRTIWFHWIHTIAFLVLIFTGAILFFPGIGAPAAGGMTRFIHRIAVVIFVAAPLIYFFLKFCILFFAILPKENNFFLSIFSRRIYSKNIL